MGNEKQIILTCTFPETDEMQVLVQHRMNGQLTADEHLMAMASMLAAINTKLLLMRMQCPPEIAAKLDVRLAELIDAAMKSYRLGDLGVVNEVVPPPIGENRTEDTPPH